MAAERNIRSVAWGKNDLNVKGVRGVWIKIDVTGRYRQELLDIKNKLNQLENDRYYEKSGVKMDGYLATNIQDLRRSIADLLYKIEYGEDSTMEKLHKAIDKIDL